MTIPNHVAANGWLFDITHRAGLARPEDVGVDDSLPLPVVWAELARANSVDETAISGHIADYFRLEVANLDLVETKALKLVPPDLARKHHVLPISEDDRNIVIATLNPTDFDAEQDLGFASGRSVVFQMSSPTVLKETIENRYAPERLVEGLLSRFQNPNQNAVSVMGDDEPEDDSAVLEDSESEPVIKLVNVILRDAVVRRSSDIHVEPGRNGGVVRFRVDGVMLEYMQMPMPALNRVVSRIKIMSKLDIADRIRPQDGRARIKVSNVAYDLRVSTVPTREAEKAVIRILPTENVTGVDGLGLSDYELERFRYLLGHRSGIVIVTGPTGSGKTTTLYAAVNELAGGELNIMTVEDPIEYDIPGITQIQVDIKKGVTFASSLRAALRQDPDVIFVGEIRDAETAGIALQASLTGHLVLATLHTNDAVGVVGRLTDLGLDAPDIVSSLRGCIAQRLIRRVCTGCSEKITGPLTAEEESLAERYGAAPVVRAVGCEECSNTGYKGRLPVDEALVVDVEFEALVSRGATQAELKTAASQGGMRPLAEVALDFVAQGLSTLQEVDRTLGETDSGRMSTQRFTRETRALEPEVLRDQLTGLVVDDDPVNRRIARRLLENAGFEIDEAVDGVDAMEVLGKGREYDLMVLDLDMPRMGGLEVLGNVRGPGAHMDLPVIVSTGSSCPEAEASVFDVGADDYVRKPLDPAKFMARVKAVLRRTSGKTLPEKAK